MPDLLIGIGDLHGHYPALEALLSGLDAEYGIFEDRPALRLNEGVQLVTTGDYIDRGSSSLRLLDMLMRLRAENPGRAVQLFGNHELLALAGLGRAKEILSSYAGREDGLAMDGLLTAYRTTIHGRNGAGAFIREFGEGLEGFRSYVARLSRGGDIGDWMRGLAPLHLASIGGKDVLFVHGGIPAELRTREALDRFVGDFREHVDQHDSDKLGWENKYFLDSKVGPYSIFWDRQLPEISAYSAKKLLDDLKADYLVVGHTPNGCILKMHDRIFDIDVGMSPAYGECEPAAIVFKEEGVFGFYRRHGEEKLTG